MEQEKEIAELRKRFQQCEKEIYLMLAVAMLLNLLFFVMFPTSFIMILFVSANTAVYYFCMHAVYQEQRKISRRLVEISRRKS